MVANAVLSSVLQLLFFSLIPFIVFLFRKDKSEKFPAWIGLTSPGRSGLLLALAASLIFVAAGLAVALMHPDLLSVLQQPPSVTGMLHDLGPTGTGIAVLLLTAWIKTALSEEILFRGLIARQLVHKLGFTPGNLIQSIIFAAVHLLLFGLLTKAGLFFLFFIFVFSGLAGWVIGYIKYKRAGGSIVPGWIAHGLGNSISYAVIAFAM